MNDDKIDPKQTFDMSIIIEEKGLLFSTGILGF
jgi:hypothetical protein